MEMIGVDMGSSTFDLTLSIAESSAGLSASVEYNTDLFNRTTIERMLRHFKKLLSDILANPDQNISQFPIIDPDERRQILFDWNRTKTDYPQDKLIHQMFEAQVEKTPEAIAVSAPAENGNNEITYAELNRRANQLAHYLQNNQVKPESIIAVYMERSPEMITALLGILKAGAAYLPIDLNHPEERISFMLEDAGVQILLTQKSLAQRLPKHNVKTIFIDTEWDDISNQSAKNPAAIAKADNLAYIIYTSGSTGKPKGVQIPNSSLTNYVYSAFDNFKMSSKDRVLQFASISFDAAAEEIYPCLCCGAALILRTENMISSPQIFLRMTGEWGVTLLDLPTAYWHQLMDEISAGNLKIPDTLRLVILGGERAVPEKLLDWQKQAGEDVQLVNTYGPTEATIVATIWELPEASDKKPFDKEVPIGRPVANTQTYILDKHLNPVPVGAAGELHIGGSGLARGYLNCPELTSQCFISNPFSADKNNRIYKTGDLARYLPGGNIEFLGRIDHQVKIRGFRIELGEIETLLRKHPSVKDAVLLAREDAPGEKRLTAYFVTKENTEVSADELRKYLKNELPDYMVPSAFMKLEKMPVTTSGKIDRRALPEPDQDQIMQELQAEYVAPRTPTEEVVASVFSQTLGIERVGAVHNFFELGGHSLMATQLISKLNKTFEIEIPLRSIFENPTVTGLALTVDTLKTAQAGLKIPEIKPVSRDLDLPLSFAQHRLWFLDQLEPNSPFYNLPETYRISGPLNVSILEDSINEIIRRHESLRTYFWTIDGSPIQKIEPEVRIELPIIDISAIPEQDKESKVLRIAKERALQPISLDALPLFKLELIKISKNEHAVILIFHHIISDNWSSRILMSEMAGIYSAFSKGGLSPLPKLPIQYADFAYWQRNWLQGEVLEKQIDYWKNQLADSPPVLELPIDRPRPAMQTFNGSFKTFKLSKKVSDGIKNLTKHEGATLFMTLLAAFQTLLYRYSGQDDISVGAPIANRNRAEIEGLIGFFVNTLVMRGDLSGNPGFRELIKRVRETALGAYAHQDLPFEKIVDAIQPERNMSHSPLFQVMFVLQNSAGTMQPAGRSELTLSPIEAHSNTAKFDLTLFMVEEGGNLGGALEYNTDLFDDSTITRMMDHFKRLLESIASAPDCGISNLTMISEKDKNQLLTDWNGVDKKHVLDQNVRRIFERQVKQTPHNIAVEFEGNKLTYRELNQRANQLAHYLQDLGVGADVLAGVSIERSIEMVIALLGILKAGGAYVPIDPSYPQERLAYILEDSQIAVLLTREKLLDVLPEHKARAVCIDADWDTIQKQSSENTIVNIDPDNLAYMIYTSGSTGKPKGTLITQRGLTNYLNWAYSAYPLNEGRGSLVHSTIAFDATVTAVFTPLLTGKTITLIPDNADLEALANTLRKTGGFNLIKITPAHLDLLSQQIPANEAAKWQGSGSVPIGKAIYNTRVYVLNEYMQPVPAGAAGELYIGGEGVARGYMNRPGLTAERFIPDPFSNKPGARLYKTGDLVRYLKDGIMEFIGRVDNQVKIRGYRIELGEIEIVLIRNEQINDCVVLAREDIPGDRRLVAYYITEGQADPSITELRNFLKEELPDYMIPAAFVMLDEFPLTPNGKVDRKALPQPDFSRPDLESEFVAPRTEDEKRLAEIWMNILNIEKVGIHDNFFELGGHSLIATQFIARIRDAFGVELPLRALFESPTIIGLIHEIDQARLADILPAPPPLVKVPRDGDIPVSFTQQRLWFLDQLSPNNSFYNLPTAMRLIGKLDVDILEKTIQEIIRRHEILHTTFAYKDGQPVQVIESDFKFELGVTDLTSLPEEDREKTAGDMAEEEAREAFDLELGPLLRVNLIKMAQNDYVIMYTMHHIISDGWSVNILMREVAALYENFSKGLPSPLPELAVQFADYAVWQRGWLTDELLQKQIGYWKETIGINPPALHLPTDQQRPAIQTFKGNTQSGFIPKELGYELQRLGRKEGATLFMALLAAFQTLLYRYSRQEEFLLGSPIASRNHIETEALIGFFVNTLVLKADFSEDPDFMTLLKIVRETTLGAFSHQDLPFEQLVEILQPERDMSHSPLFQVMFVLQNTPPPRGIALSDIKIEPVKARDNTAKFDLSFVIMESSRGFATEFEYNTDLFDKSTIIRMQEHFTTLLEQIVEHPNQPLSTLPLMKPEKAKELLLDWNQTQVDFPDDKCIHELFENQVNKTPGAAALVYDDQELTYGELNQRANQLAHYLRQSRVSSEKIVGISVDRSIEKIFY
jgi:amino acid adenylation domain-containing protein